MLSGYLAHFSHPLRLRLICQLAKGEKCVNDLVAVTGGLQTTVSGQLKYLTMAGIVAPERRGANVFYRIADERATGLLRHLVAAFGLAKVKSE
jgi:DNA-binding transcriptional ArsR family regulator